MGENTHIYIHSKLGFKHWTEIFEFIMCSANKPTWFTSNHSFRAYDRDLRKHLIHPVEKLSRKQVYTGGSLFQFSRSTGLRPDEV